MILFNAVLRPISDEIVLFGLLMNALLRRIHNDADATGDGPKAFIKALAKRVGVKPTCPLWALSPSMLIRIAGCRVGQRS